MFKLQHMISKIYSRVKLFHDDQRDIKTQFKKGMEKNKEESKKILQFQIDDFAKKMVRDKEMNQAEIERVKRQLKNMETQ